MTEFTARMITAVTSSVILAICGVVENNIRTGVISLCNSERTEHMDFMD